MTKVLGAHNVADLYSVLTKDMFLYGELPVAIPEPRFVVFYNGEQKMEERAVLRLSDLYRPRTEHPYRELETLVLNINKGYNAELMEKCRELHDYSVFVALVREKRKNGRNLKHAVNEAIDECIHQDIMADFLRRNRAEVVKMSIYEYDEEKVKRMFKEECMKLGMEQGKQIGIEQGIEQARVIFRLYISGKSEEDIARETGETIEMIHKVLKG